jgi:hypothetical protein
MKLCLIDDPWWENIPDEISFSPVSSFSYTSLTSDLVKPPGNARSDDLRPSVNDFLDISDESKTNVLEEKMPKPKENNCEQVKSPHRSPARSLDGSIKIENNLRGAKDGLRINDENPEVAHRISNTDEVTPRNASSIPRLILDENSQNSRGRQRSAHQKSWKTNSDENDRTLGDDFQDFGQNSRKSHSDLNSRKTDKNSQKFRTNSRKSVKEYEVENFQSNFPRDEWQQRNGLETRGQVEEEAALTIQRCYRGYKTRMQAGYSAVHKALEEKRAVMERQKKVRIMYEYLRHFHVTCSKNLMRYLQQFRRAFI